MLVSVSKTLGARSRSWEASLLHRAIKAWRRIIAKRIIDTAQGGNDPRQLADDAVDFLRKSYA